MNNADYKVALQTLRRILDEGFFDTDYAINWIDNVLAGQQDPSKSVTPAVESMIRAMREGINKDNYKELTGQEYPE